MVVYNSAHTGRRMGHVIQPTFKCFDDAVLMLDMLLDEFARGRSEVQMRQHPAVRELEQRITVVHGLCRAVFHGDTAPSVYAHAWVEEQPLAGTQRHDPLGIGRNTRTRVWQGGLVDGKPAYYAVLAEPFYRAYHVVTTTRYSIAECAEHSSRTAMAGPWRHKYRAHAFDSSADTTGRKVSQPIGADIVAVLELQS